MERIIKIGETEVLMKANALTPILYANNFKGKDMMNDMLHISKQIEGVTDEAEIMRRLDVEIFYRVAYVMSDAPRKHVKFYDWLEQFELMDMYDALPEIMDLWLGNKESSLDVEVNSKNARATATE